MNLTVVFVHGWSVTNLNTYGELPLRLQAEAAQNGFTVNIEEIFLGRYISFHDEVRMPDISRAFNTAVKEQLSAVLVQGARFICITHSTGGPVIRDWWQRYYKNASAVCPMSHLIMLAPANYGSALAQLGKGKLSRLKSWWNGVEPGQGVLDWLALGSSEAWELNKDWIYTDNSKIGGAGIFPFVITGQDIDRKFYDHLNTYTGELGSDGVVRTAAANLQGRYLKLVQQVPVKNAKGEWIANSLLEEGEIKVAMKTPLRVLTNKSHSGNEMGILKSVKQNTSDLNSSETVKAIFDCIKIRNTDQFNALAKQFDSETDNVQRNEKVEIHNSIFPSERYFIHDRYSMVIFRVCDNQGFPVKDFDLVLTAGKDNDPDHLPVGFFVDRQQNSLNKETLTYFFNYDIMKGTDAVIINGKTLRNKIDGTDMLGLRITARPDSGFVRYLPCEIAANADMLEKVLLPNSTTLIDICLQRIVDKEVFRLNPADLPKDEWDFSDKEASGKIVE